MKKKKTLNNVPTKLEVTASWFSKFTIQHRLGVWQYMYSY